MADLDDLRNYVKGDMAEVTLKTLKAFGIRSGAGLLAVLEDEKLIDDMAAKAISFEEFPAMEFDVLVGDETKQEVKKAHAKKSIRDAAKAATNGQKGLPLEGMLLTAAKQFGCQLSERLILDEVLVQQLSQDIGAFKELYVCKATTDMPKTEQREDIEGKIVYTKRPRSGRLPVNYQELMGSLLPWVVSVAILAESPMGLIAGLEYLARLSEYARKCPIEDVITFDRSTRQKLSSMARQYTTMYNCSYSHAVLWVLKETPDPSNLATLMRNMREEDESKQPRTADGMCPKSYQECELVKRKDCPFKPGQHRGYNSRGKGKGQSAKGKGKGRKGKGSKGYSADRDQQRDQKNE